MDKIQGNGKTLAVHEFRLKSVDEKLEIIFDKLDQALPRLAVHEERINGLSTWRTWATGVGTTVTLAVLMLLVNMALGR